MPTFCRFLLALMPVIFFSGIVHSQITGTVFQDVNGNGVFDTNPIENGIGGVVINVYNTADVLAGTSTSAAAGTFSVVPSGTGPYRVEFVIPAALRHFRPSSSGSVYGTSVRFVSTGTQSGVNFALYEAANYTANQNPSIVGTRQFEGERTGVNSALPVVFKATYLSNGNSYAGASNALPTGAIELATMNEVGTVYGLASQTSRGKVYAAAYHKRYAGFGPDGPAAIYQIDTAGTGTITGVINLSTLTGTPNVAGVDVHDFVARTQSGGGTEVFDLGPAGVGNDVFAGVGTRSLGDIEISPDERSLYVLNLFTRQIYSLDVSTGNTASTSISFTWNAPDATGASRHRPFALKWYRGLLYVGSVDQNGSNAYVHSFDPTVPSPTFNLVLTIPLNFTRQSFIGTANQAGRQSTWLAWANDPTTITLLGSARERGYPQAMLSDIQFDAVGNMVLGFRDRFGDQFGYERRFITTSTQDWFATSAGDLLRACINASGTAWLLEGAAGCTTADGLVNSGPGGASFPEHYEWDFWEDGTAWDVNSTTGGLHWELAQGALAQLPGSAVVLTTAMDPFGDFSGGFIRFTNSNGRREGITTNSITGPPTTGGYAVYDAGAFASGYPASIGNFAKANGLGDVELLGILPPIEIGNRVWNDANGNGIQDAGEVGLGSVVLQLFLDADNNGVPDGAAIGTVTTATDGTFFFTSAAGTDVTGIDFGVSLTANQNYILRVGAAEWNAATGLGTGDLANYRLTANDITGNGAVDVSDNDAVLTTGATVVPQIRFTTGNFGEHNHNLDFGFSQLASIGDRVWLDQNGNGTQDGTPGTAGYEPGVAGVTVELFRNGTDGLPGTADDVLVGTTVTDAFGNYLFEDLTPTVQTNATTIAQTSYNVKFTPPAKYTFTTSTTPGDNGNNTNSDANPNQLSAQYGRTGGYNLTAGEIDNSADAGLIFPTPQLATIGDRVWLDNGQGGGTANDGLQNGTEVGVSGVTVTLFRDPDGAGGLPAVPFATTITDANGNYLFSNIVPDPTVTYQVGFTLPIGFAFSPKDAGADAVDSDVNTSGPNFGRTDAFTVPTATTITTVDAGINASALASVGNFVWNDLDQDGVQDAGEPGIAGITVNLYNSVGVIIATTVTDALGQYQFTGLAAGIYEVGFVAPTGYSFSTAGVGAEWTDSDANTGTGRTGTFTLVAGQNKDDVDAGLSNNSTATLNRLGDRVWYDNNNNGIQDAGEFGAPGVSVALLDANGLPVDDPRQAGIQPYITTTDLNGNYLFTDLPNGSYQVRFYNVPGGYSFITSANAGGATTNNSDAGASGVTPVYSLTGSQTNLTVDAGLIRRTETGTASLGNKVFYDINSNGIQDAGETGVAGVTVTLRTPGADGIAGNGDDVTVATLVTNSLGEYLFTNLSAGVYYVQFSNGPAGYNTSAANTGSDDAQDSDGTAAVTISSATSTTGLYNLGAGEQNLTVDLGLVKTTAGRGSISNQVWFDTNGNGTFNSGTDAVVPGVQVELLNGSGNAIDPDGAGPLTRTITTTDVNGNYLFDNLTAGSYIVNFSNYPAGLTPVAQDVTLTNNRSAGNGAGSTPVITLAASQNLTNIDQGLTTTRAALGDRVWNDLNGNGQQDAGEPGLAGVTVILRDAATGNPVSSTVTDANGNYLFTNLDAGSYVVEFTNIPGSMTFTTKDSGADGTDSDVNPGTGRTDAFTLTAGQVNLTVDAGVRNVPTATVGTYVWYDNGFGGGTSGDGIAQAGEPPVAGVLVTLFDAGTNQPLQSAVTTSNGEYRFTNVAPGTYYVVFSELPGPGLNFTTQLPGTTDSQSKSNSLGRTPNFTVAAGDNLVFVDAGLIGAPLPATGLQLQTQLTNNTVTLNWKTLSEISTDYFEVERSTDGQAFTSLARVTAAGFSATERGYSHDDDVSGVSHNGILYYRVKLYDIDGSYRYSNVSVVRINTAAVKAWPNPFTEVIQITISSNSRQEATLQLSDVSGRRILVRNVTLNKGVNQVSLTNLSGLPSGNYYLQITTADGTERTLLQLSR